MKKRMPIVGGGTAGWLAAGYLARTLGAQSSSGIEITLVESAEIGILGMGEGAFPTIRKTLRRISIDEATLVREASATFKQGARFAHWRFEPGRGQPDLVDALPEDEARRFVREMIRKTAQAMPPHAKFLEGLAAAPTPAGMIVGRSGSTIQAAR